MDPASKKPRLEPATTNIATRRGEPLVVIENVNKHYGELHVLKNINTVVARGEVVVVIGPSGSGKSTFCRAINRLETIDDGSITIDGEQLPEEGAALARLRALSASASPIRQTRCPRSSLVGSSSASPSPDPWQ